MPTAIPAVLTRPAISKTRPLSLVFALPVIASVIASLALFANPASVAAHASPSCPRWGSVSHPPDSIRVLRHRSGRIVTVPFRKYVVTVMGKEWPSYLPQAVVEAGAIAVKQFGWYHTLYTSRTSDGRCFDVQDGTNDQIYNPSAARVTSDHYRAVDATWGVTLRRKDGSFFLTGYRTGAKVRCARDATGYKLFARSATQCAYNGWDWRRILQTYYGPNVQFMRDASTGSPAAAPAGATDATAADSPAFGPAAASVDVMPTADSGTEPTADPAITQQTSEQTDPAVATAVGGLGGGDSCSIAAALDSLKSLNQPEVTVSYPVL